MKQLKVKLWMREKAKSKQTTVNSKQSDCKCIYRLPDLLPATG